MAPKTLKYVSGSPTSKAAADSMIPHAPNIKERVFECVRKGDFINHFGATCDEIEMTLSLKHQTVSARIRELAEAGRIEDSGMVRKTRSNRNAVVWVAS